MKKPSKPEFDADGYQVHQHDLNGEGLPSAKLEFRHGGVRVGAGRKPSGRKPILLRLKPSVIKRLRLAAKRQKKTISEVAEEKLAAC